MERIGAFMVSHPWMVTFPLVVLSGLAVFVGAYNYFEVRNQEQRVLRIERSPCQSDPAGPECAALRRQTALQEPLSNPCISFRRIIRPRAVFRKYTRCGDYRRAHEKGRSRESTLGGKNDGDSSTTGATPGTRSTGGSVPSGPGSSGGGGSNDGGGGNQPAPPNPPDPPAPTPPTPTPPDPPSPSAPTPPSLGDQIGNTVDGVTNLGCQVTNALGICIK